MRLSLLVTHFVIPAAYPIPCKAEPTDHAFHGIRIIPYTLLGRAYKITHFVTPAPYPIPYETEPTDHVFRAIRSIPYTR
jgi:hypothetical protein